jgi:hypothetical protein
MGMSRELKFSKLNKTENWNTVICKIETEISRIILKVYATEMDCKNVKVSELTQNAVPGGTQIMTKINFFFFFPYSSLINKRTFIELGRV